MNHNSFRVSALLLFVLLPILTFAQPSADFTVDKTEGCAPLSVIFSDTSTPASSITDWQWEVNGASFSSSQNPSYLINTPGQYSICLTVTDAAGATNTTCKNDYIQVFAKPVANFTASPTEGCGPLEVAFSSTSSSSNGDIVSWVWDLSGPCGILPGSTAKDVSCTYTAAGNYKPTLIITDDKGCQASLTRENPIVVFPDPDIQVNSDYTFACDPPFTVNFINENAEANTNYQWDFGNGQTFTGAFPSAITYTDRGPYTVTIQAVNQQTGCQNTLVLEDYLSAGFEVDFSFNSNGGCGDLNINFVDNSLDGATDILWDFGDGNTSIFSSPSYTYAGPGCYDVVLTRTVNGCVNSLQRLLCISDPANLPIAATVSAPIGCEVPHSVNFQGTSAVAETWFWDFGDGNTSTEQNPSHNYTAFGIYPVSLTIQDAFGCEKTIAQDTVEVESINIQVAGLPLQGCLPFSFSLEDSVSSIVPIVSWRWEVIDINGNIIFNSNQAQPSGSINQAGCFDILLEVTNSLGCVKEKVFQSALCAGNIPDVNFSAMPLQTCAEQPVSFTNLADTTVNSWAWDFNGDGIFDSFESDPSYQYQDTGCFTVTLLVGSNGCFNQVTIPNYVCILPPVARFNITQDCASSFDRTFVSKAIGADSTLWDFGVPGLDTDTSTLLKPTFTFPYKDTFEVTQVVFNFDSGCTDTMKTKIIITELQANFTIASDMGCAPMTLDITNTSVDADRWRWISAGSTINNWKFENPIIRYPNGGTYDLKLIVLDVNNCRDTFDYSPILVNEINPDFTSMQLSPCLPVDVQFDDNSSNLYATNVQWDWIFGTPGDLIGSSSGENIIYTFDEAGFIPTKLIVTDSWGCVDSILVDEGININAPFANFVVDSFSCPGLDLAFDNLSGGTNLTYLWDFGDGTTSTLENPNHEYGLGVYQASLTISTANCMHTYSQEIQVESVTADFTVNPDYPPCPPATVTFNDLSTNAYDYEWIFGDNTGASDQASHIYTERGYFDVSLVAIGGNAACRDTLSLDSLVAILGPSGEFFFDVNNRCLPAEITLYGSSDRPYNYTWFLDDGNTVYTANTTTDTVNYIYQDINENGFIPKLMLASTCDTVIVSPDTLFVTELEIDFVASDTFLCDGENMVAFESLVETNEDAFVAEWSFPGGNPSNSNQADVAIEYLRPGFHDVTLRIDNGDCQDTITKEQYIEVVDFINLQVEDAIICAGDTVQLSAISNATELIWSPLENIIGADSLEPYVHPNQTIDYVVTGNYKTCNTAVDTATVEVLALPQVTYSPLRRYFPDQSIMLEVLPADGISDYQYEWFPTTGLSCANCANPTASLDTNMVYTITITNPSSGCMTQIEMSVRKLTDCPEDLIYMPTAFSPNDDGNNDDFRMYSSTISDIDYFRIYDRWGALIWQTSDSGEGWDGTFRGNKMNPGVYVYVLEAPCILNDRTILKKGGITLMR